VTHIEAVALEAVTRPAWQIAGLSREELDAGLIGGVTFNQMAESSRLARMRFNGCLDDVRER
jgi:hypothetical protein